MIKFPETENYPDGIGGGLIDGLKQVQQVMLSKDSSNHYLQLIRKLVVWILGSVSTKDV